MKIRSLANCFILIISLLSGNVNAGWDDIDWGSCGPGSISKRLKLATDKKGFWISQSVDLEEIAKTNQLMAQGWEQSCYLENKSDTKKTSCLIELDLKMKNIYRCLAHAQQMCRLHGGYC